MTMVVLVMVKVETDRLKAVLCAVRQWLRFQLHREAGAAKKKTLKPNMDFEQLDLELQKHIFNTIMSYLGGWASNSGILISIYPPPQHPPPLFLSSAPPFSYLPSQLPLFCFFSPLPPFSPASSPPLCFWFTTPAKELFTFREHFEDFDMSTVNSAALH